MQQMAVADTPLINGPSFDSLSGVVEMEPHSEVDGAVGEYRELWDICWLTHCYLGQLIIIL